MTYINGIFKQHIQHLMLVMLALLFSHELFAQERGIPIHVNRGIQKTTAEIMATPPPQRPANFEQIRDSWEPEGPDREHLPQAPGAIDAPQWPLSKGPAPNPAPLLSPQTIGIQFDGATGPPSYPPDTDGAVGLTQFFVFVNQRMRTFNKTTGVADGVIDIDPDVFFAAVETPPATTTFVSDPQVRFDRLSGRWFLTIIDVSPGVVRNRLLIAVSDGPVITAGTVWTFYYFQDTTYFLDYPSLGIDASALYIGGNMFTSSSGSYAGTKGYVIPKAPLLTASPITVYAFNLAPLGSAGPFAPRGVDNYDPANTGPTAVGYFIGVDVQLFSKLQIRRVTDPGGTPTISANIPISTPISTYYPISVRHKNGSPQLDALGDRLFAAHLRNGKIWTAHNIGVDNTGSATPSRTRNAARWYEIDVATTLVSQAGTLYDNTGPNDVNQRNYWIPSIMVSGQGHAALGCSIAGTNEYINAFTTGRLAGDPLGTLREGPGGSSLPGYTSSSTSYNVPLSRWGDYSYTSLDPQDDMTMWTIQQYCNGTNTYGVRAVKLIAPPPATPASSNPSIVEAGQPSVNVTITGTSISGSGFYDPGTDVVGGTPFNHISASVTGGVTVNSVTYTDPTHITLNISTNGATLGAQNITITNPDGQFLTGTGIITIGHVSHTFVVTNTNDTGAGSLRQAIADANALGNINASTPDTILFNIAGSGTHTIAPTSYLEDITDPVIIDGFSQPGASAGAPLIVINGASALAFTRGLSLSGGHSTVQGLVINGFSGSGVVLQSDGNTLKGNFIGTDATGTSAVPNDFGVLENGGSYNLIGGSTAGSGNLISGNTNSGIYMNGTGYNHIQGNKIGTNITGTAAIPNQDGVFIKNSAHTVIGGTTAAERNLISGNRADAIFLRGSFQNTIIGNYLGTDVTGTLDLGNGADGFSIGDGGHDNTLGGTTTAERNIISGNNRFGIYFFGTGTTGNRIIGNYIGTDVSGSNPLGNDDDGVALFPDGGNRVGGTSAGEGNIIAYNGQAGVDVVAGGSLTPNNSNPILGNSIFGNTGLGIDLTVNPGTPGQHDGLTPNDAGDPDEGGNRLQNFPEITAMDLQTNGDLSVTYSVPSAVANATYPLRIEFFISQGGQGKTFLGAQEYASANAESPVTQTFTPNAVVSAGDKIVATATDANGNTSEFASEFTVAAGSYDIYLVDTKTGNTSRVTLIDDADEYNPSFAPDGKHIVHDVLGGPAALGHSLYITDISTGVSVPLTGGEGGNDASWSPNSMYIAFDRTPDGDQSIYIVPAGGGTPTLVRADAVDAEWSNNSKRLVFKDITDGSLRTVDLNGGSETTIATSGINPSWSPNGKAIAYSDGNSIFTVAVNQKGQPKGSPQQLTDDGSGVFNQQPSWSNNSKAIVFHSNRESGDFDIWTVSASGGTPSLLSGDPDNGDYDPCYSKNGKYVAYAGFTLPASSAAPLSLNSGILQLNNELTMPDEFSLAQNYPNPFNPTTQIRFALPQAENVSLRIYDVAGQLIKTLISGNMDAGYYNIQWDGSNQYGSKVASGIYLYRITAGSFVQTKKMILMK